MCGILWDALSFLFLGDIGWLTIVVESIRDHLLSSVVNSDPVMESCHHKDINCVVHHTPDSRYSSSVAHLIGYIIIINGSFPIYLRYTRLKPLSSCVAISISLFILCVNIIYMDASQFLRPTGIPYYSVLKHRGAVYAAIVQKSLIA